MQPSDKLLNNKPAIISSIVGSLLCGILLSFGVFFFNKWYKNRREQNNTVQIPGSDNNIQTERNIYDQRQAIPINDSYKYGDEILQIPGNNYTHTTNEPIAPALSFNNSRQGIPVANNERLSSQSIDDLKYELKHELKQEFRNLRQEILQNNEQASSSNISKNE